MTRFIGLMQDQPHECSHYEHVWTTENAVSPSLQGIETLGHGRPNGMIGSSSDRSDHLEVRDVDTHYVLLPFDRGSLGCHDAVSFAARQFIKALHQRLDPRPNQSHHTAVAIEPAKRIAKLSRLSIVDGAAGANNACVSDIASPRRADICCKNTDSGIRSRKPGAEGWCRITSARSFESKSPEVNRSSNGGRLAQFETAMRRADRNQSSDTLVAERFVLGPFACDQSAHRMTHQGQTRFGLRLIKQLFRNV